MRFSIMAKEVIYLVRYIFEDGYKADTAVLTDWEPEKMARYEAEHGKMIKRVVLDTRYRI
jgi:hypothetical protein